VPTYQYQCTQCGEGLEAVQKFTDDPLTECPTCSGRLRKVFNSVGIVFKGSGFYRTDSRSGGASSTVSAKGAEGGSSNGSKSGDSKGSSDSANGGSKDSSKGGGESKPTASASKDSKPAA
jgi:putative FmdB family regulatory protein